MRRYYFLIAGVVSSLILAGPLKGQDKADSLLAEQLYEKSERSLRTTEKRHIIAIKDLQRAYEIFESLELWGRAVDCLNLQARMYWIDSNYDSAQMTAEKSLFLNKSYDVLNKETRKGHALGVLGRSLRDTGNKLRAETYLNKAIDILKKHDGQDSILLAGAYNDIGVLNAHKDDVMKAIYFYKKALKIQERAEGVDDSEKIISYVNIAFAYQKLRLYNQTLVYLKLALSANHEKSTFLYVNSLRRLASTYLNMNKGAESLKTIQKALKSVDQTSGPLKSFIYIDAGRLFNSLGYVDSAYFYIQKGIKSMENSNSWYHMPIYYSIGEVYESKGLNTQAELFYLKTINYRTNEDVNRPSVFKLIALNRLARLHENDLQTSLKEYESAISKNLDNVDGENYKSPDFGDVIDKHELLFSFSGKARVLEKMYEEDNLIENLKEALIAYDYGSIVIKNIKSEIKLFNDQLYVSNISSSLFSDALALSIKLYKMTGNIKYLNKSLEFSEKGRSSILDSQLSGLNFKQSEISNDSLFIREKELLGKIDHLKSLILKEERTSTDLSRNDVTTIETQLYETNKSYDSVINNIKIRFPESSALKRDDNTISIKDIQSKIHEDQILIEYYMADSLGYIFTITKDSVSYHKVDAINVHLSIEDFRNSIKTKNTTKFKIKGHALYQLLLHQSLDGLDQTQVTIIPHGSLWHLNFDLLLTKETSTSNPKEFPYLLKERSISYANSLSLVNNRFEVSADNLTKETLAFSYSDSSSVVSGDDMSFRTLRAAGDDLPGSRREIANIADVVDGKYYYGNQSNEKNFKAQADKYSVLHLALHGEIDDENPLNSRLYFSPTKDSVEDNFLYGFELNSLHLPADLAILSACNTGDGKIAKGEGILSLGSAFQYAGTKSLVLSSWEVSDNAAPDLMKHFYTNLKEGMNKAEALRQAKLKYLAEAPQALSDPFYWGNFYLVGDNSPIEFEEDGRQWIIWLSLTLLSIFAFWFMRGYLFRKTHS